MTLLVIARIVAPPPIILQYLNKTHTVLYTYVVGHVDSNDTIRNVRPKLMYHLYGCIFKCSVQQWCCGKFGAGGTLSGVQGQRSGAKP